jgi:ferredoxin-NADP reductase
MIKERLPAPSIETLILYCGPPPFEDMMKKHLSELGYTDDMIFKF